jgi:hypothetical protein
MRSVLCLLLLFLCIPAAFSAEPVPRDDAAVEKVVTAAFGAATQLDWQKYADLMHPDGLREIKGMLSPVLEKVAPDSREETRILRYFAGAKDVKQLLGMAPAAFFASYLKGTTSRLPIATQDLRGLKFRIIGTVYEKDGTAHVVYRSSFKRDDNFITKVEIVSLKRHQMAWRILLTMEIKRSVAQVLRLLE